MWHFVSGTLLDKSQLPSSQIDSFLRPCYTSLMSDRNQLIARYRRQGMSKSEIADILDISPSTVTSALQAHYKQVITNDEMAEALNVELARLDDLTSTYYDSATGRAKAYVEDDEGNAKALDLPADHKSAELVLKIMDRRAKLMGLDAPVKQDERKDVTIRWADGSSMKNVDGEEVDADDDDDTIIDGQNCLGAS